MTEVEFEPELVDALNMLLEDERASVEMEVALASGATEYNERDALAAMGTQDIRFCSQLRDEMERMDLPVTRQINGIVFQVIGGERYDDRLRAYAHHQRVVAQHARELQESNLDGAIREALDGIVVSHEDHSEWAERRAAAFADTRALEFGPGQAGPDISGTRAMDSSTPRGEAPSISSPSYTRPVMRDTSSASEDSARDVSSVSTNGAAPGSSLDRGRPVSSDPLESPSSAEEVGEAHSNVTAIGEPATSPESPATASELEPTAAEPQELPVDQGEASIPGTDETAAQSSAPAPDAGVAGEDVSDQPSPSSPRRPRRTRKTTE